MRSALVLLILVAAQMAGAQLPARSACPGNEPADATSPPAMDQAGVFPIPGGVEGTIVPYLDPGESEKNEKENENAALLCSLKETPVFVDDVAAGTLPAVGDRVPRVPLVADLGARGRSIGKPGGEIVTFVAKARDLRYLSVLTYGRLLGYTETLELKPDILEQVDIESERVFTFHLRPGHRWSDGKPFTAEDFRYFWVDVALNTDLSPSGPPDFMVVDGEHPRFEVIDETTVRYSWSKPNPRFLPTLAGPRDPFIYRPAHYLKAYHARYADEEKLTALAAKHNLRSWAALHNRFDDMYDQTNIAIPTLQAWSNTTAPPASRFVLKRNPYYHRIDNAGNQLPYIDRISVDIVASGLMAAKANAGDADLLVRGISMADAPILREGEAAHGYRTLLWTMARGSEATLYPNLTTKDPVWRALNRDVRFRRALSVAIDRNTINNALYFGLGKEGNNTMLEGSALFEPALRTAWANYDPATARRLLDEAGLSKRDGAGIRLLPDGRPCEIVVEVEAEATDLIDTLSLISEFWREVGVKMFIRPLDRTVMRNRAYSGRTVMFAWWGFNNALATADMVPDFLAPTSQDDSPWPAWGQHFETHGKMGESIDLDEAGKLLELYESWLDTSEYDEKRRIWQTMLRLHAEQQFTIGTVAGPLQPIVVSKYLRNIPEKALYSWEPTSMIGIYRIDEFHLATAGR